MIGLRMVVGVLVTAAAVAAVGCSSGASGPAASQNTPANGAAQANEAVAYWKNGQAEENGQAVIPQRAEVSPSARPTTTAPRVGALFLRADGGNHFCTASVVSSPDRDLLITAAHCINAGDGRGYRSDVVFIPGYRDGDAPYGIWTPARLVVAPGWAKSADPDLDVGFVVLKPRDGEDIERVLGADTMLFDPGYRNLVRVTGYPKSSGEPVTCLNWTDKHSATQLTFDCNGFTGGTSGSPWITRFDPSTRVGRIVGVLGGYQQGGDTAAVSYSAYFGPAIKQLYQEAISG